MMDTQLSLVLSRNKLLKNVDFSKIDFSNIRGKLFTISEGEILYREGDAADKIYLVISGEINLLKKRMLGKPKSYIFKENDFLGSDEYFEETSRFSTAVALRDSYLISFEKDEIQNLVEQNNKILVNLKQPTIEQEMEIVKSTSEFNSMPKEEKLTVDKLETNDFEKPSEDDAFFKSLAATSSLEEPNLIQPIGETISSQLVDDKTDEEKFNEDVFLNEDGIPKAEFDLTQIPELKTDDESIKTVETDFELSTSSFLNEDGIPKPEFELPEIPITPQESTTKLDDLDDILFKALNNLESKPSVENRLDDEQQKLTNDFSENNFSVTEEPQLEPIPEIKEEPKVETSDSPREMEMDFEIDSLTSSKGSSTEFETSEILAEADEKLRQIINKENTNYTRPSLNDGDAMSKEQLRMIIRAAELVNSTIKIDEVLKNIVEVATDLTNADRGTLYLVDREKNELRSLIAIGNETKVIRLKLGEGLAGFVAKTGEILNIKDARRDPRFRSDFDRSSGYATKTVLTLPIQNKKEEIIGVLQLLNSANGEFSKLDEELLKAMSIHAALAIQNAEMVEKLLESERIQSLGKMANFLIQDIKKPVLVSKRYVEHLRSRVLSPDHAQIVDMLFEQLGQVADLVQTTSSYSEGKTILRTLNVSLNNTLADYSSRIGAYVESRNCQIVAEYDKDVTVKLDVKEFYQCYMHIVKNSCDAMPEGGNIYISTKRDEKEKRVKIFFRDNGLGIAESLREKIFEPFFTQGKKEGAGLGLAITKKVVEGHNGRIEVQSALGEGATFIITIPALFSF